MKTISYPGIQDEVEAARESCMEEECERVEAEIEKEKVHNENRLLKVRIFCFFLFYRIKANLNKRVDQLAKTFESLNQNFCDFETYDSLKVSFSVSKNLLSQKVIARSFNLVFGAYNTLF